MPIQLSHKDDRSLITPDGRQALVDAQITNLLYKQSQLGIGGTLINAGALVFLLRNQIGHLNLSVWFAVMVLLTLMRTVMIQIYQKRDIPLFQTRQWAYWNVAGLAATGLLWGLAMVVIFPEQSLTHQLCMAFILCGVLSGSANLYVGLPVAFKAFSMSPALFLIIRLVMLNDPLHWMLAGLTALYLTLMVLTINNFAGTNRELMMAKIELEERVTERTLALEDANANLKNEIKERLKIMERLRQERDRLEIITIAAGAGLAVITKNYKILWANRIFKETFGEVGDSPCFRFCFQRDTHCVGCGVKKVFEQGGEKVVHEQQCFQREGEPLWFQIVTTPIRNSQGRIRAALELVLPITERKQAELARQRISEQLEEARKTEAIATLAGGIAHQFNNALGVISGNIDLLAEDYRYDDQIKTYTEPIVNAAGRMTRLTKQLLAYAKGGKYKEESSDMSAVAETTLNLIKHTIKSRIAVKKALAGGLPLVKIDVTQIQMVISAIIANASEAIARQGEVLISSFRLRITEDNSCDYGEMPCGEYVALSIRDDGAGMDPQTLQRIFEPFYTTKFQGRGLGMAAVYGIIKNHGGHIQIFSEAGQGTEVKILLPALREMKETPRQEVRGDLKGGGVVLLIEDDRALSDITQTWLKRVGYDVVPAANADQTIRAICHSNKRFDLVLLDMVLPDTDGASVYPLIRQYQPSARVIVCSGYSLDGPAQQLMDAGADAFLQKPYSIADLKAVILGFCASP